MKEKKLGSSILLFFITFLFSMIFSQPHVHAESSKKKFNGGLSLYSNCPNPLLVEIEETLFKVPAKGFNGSLNNERIYVRSCPQLDTPAVILDEVLINGVVTNMPNTKEPYAYQVQLYPISRFNRAFLDPFEKLKKEKISLKSLPIQDGFYRYKNWYISTNIMTSAEIPGHLIIKCDPQYIPNGCTAHIPWRNGLILQIASLHKRGQPPKPDLVKMSGLDKWRILYPEIQKNIDSWIVKPINK